MKTAAVFSGAGAKILYESGFAKALVESKIDYQYLIGTSSGAITAAFVAAGQVDDLIDMCLTLRNKDIYSHAPWKLMTAEACFYDNAPLRRLLKSKLNTLALRGSKIQCVVNATNCKSWTVQPFVLNNLSGDDIVEAILASTCVPVAFPRKNDLVDGGVVDDYPIMDAVVDAVDQVILFSPSIIEPFSVKNALGALNEFISISLYSQMTNELRALQATKSNVKLTIIQPDKPVNIGVLDFNAFPSVELRRQKIEEARQLAAAALKPMLAPQA